MFHEFFGFAADVTRAVIDHPSEAYDAVHDAVHDVGRSVKSEIFGSGSGSGSSGVPVDGMVPGSSLDNGAYNAAVGAKKIVDKLL